MKTSSVTVFKKNFDRLLEPTDSIIITTHKMPDDDAISSVLSLDSFLKQTYSHQQTSLIIEDEPNLRWKNFPQFSTIQFVADLSAHLKQAQILIYLDCNQYHRFTNNPQAVEKFSGKKISIDHHKSNPDPCDLAFINPEAVANAYNIFQLFGPKKTLTPELATNILLGIIGDTGNLRFIPPSQAHIFSIVDTLLTTANINLQTFLQYQTYSPQTIQTYQQLIKNHQVLKIAAWPPLACTYINQTYLIKHQISPIQANEAIHLYADDFSRLQQEVTWSLSFYPKQDHQIKVSARSLPESVNVRKLMETLQIGSGHDRAAGGSWSMSTQETAQDKLQEFIAWLKTHPVITD